MDALGSERLLLSGCLFGRRVCGPGDFFFSLWYGLGTESVAVVFVLELTQHYATTWCVKH